MNDSQTAVFDDTLSDAKQQQLLVAAKAGLFVRHESFSVIDLDALTKTVGKLQAAFPDHFLHTFAIKANFYLPVLRHLADYAAVLRDKVPDLFSGKFKVMTEFGRAVVAKSACSVARVEYTKNMGGRQIALTHAGAHNMMRIVFQPEVWARRVTALLPSGQARTGDRVIQDVAGPCCFAGDTIAHQRPLPLLEPGDEVMVHDTGAYCFSNHFMYNALGADPVYACSLDGDGEYIVSMMNTGEDVETLVNNFS